VGGVFAGKVEDVGRLQGPVLADGEAVVVLVDDNKARIAIQLGHEFDIDLMATESLITWMRDGFRMPNAENAWAAIRIAAGNNVPDTRDDDPVYLRPCFGKGGRQWPWPSGPKVGYRDIGVLGKF
jgi:hypothetical protein